MRTQEERRGGLTCDRSRAAHTHTRAQRRTQNDRHSACPHASAACSPRSRSSPLLFFRQACFPQQQRRRHRLVRARSSPQCSRLIARRIRSRRDSRSSREQPPPPLHPHLPPLPLIPPPRRSWCSAPLNSVRRSSACHSSIIRILRWFPLPRPLPQRLRFCSLRDSPRSMRRTKQKRSSASMNSQHSQTVNNRVRRHAHNTRLDAS